MRLTNAIRQQTLDVAVKTIIAPKISAVGKELKSMAEDIARVFYSKKVQAWIDAAPKGGLFSRSDFTLEIAGEPFAHDLLRTSRRYGGSSPYIVTIKSILVLKQDEYNSNLKASKKQIKRLKEVSKILDKIQEDKKLLRSTLTSALWGCNTQKQLLEHYPDLNKYLPPAVKQTKALVVTNADVRKVLKT